MEDVYRPSVIAAAAAALMIGFSSERELPAGRGHDGRHASSTRRPSSLLRTAAERPNALPVVNN
jgi:hypothetical protein